MTGANDAAPSMAADPAAVLDLVADETRLAALLALVEHRRETPRGEWPTFSELRRRAGVRDSGNFSYHLDRLRDRFVEKDGDAYRLTHQGTLVASALLAGAYDVHEGRSADLDADCVFCGGPLTASVDRGTVTITCEAGHAFTQELPPGAVAERSMADLLSLVALKMRTDAAFVLDGVCPTCYGDLEVAYPPEPPVAEMERVFVAACGRCGLPYGGPPAMLALAHPAVVAFYDRHGVDLSERPFWRVDFPAHETTVAAETPLRVRVDVRLDDDRLGVTFDGDASVVDVEEG